MCLSACAEDDIGESEVIYDAFMVTIQVTLPLTNTHAYIDIVRICVCVQSFKDEAARGVNILVGKVHVI